MAATRSKADIELELANETANNPKQTLAACLFMELATFGKAPMNSQKWKNVGEIVGVSAIVASLIFVGVQLRQDREIAVAQSLEVSEASVNAINVMISDNAEVWLKGRKNEELSEFDSIIMSRIVAALWRRARYVAEMRRNLGRPGTAAMRDFAIELYENPGARRAWETLSDNEIAYFAQMAPHDNWRRNYRDEALAELGKLDSIKR